MSMGLVRIPANRLTVDASAGDLQAAARHRTTNAPSRTRLRVNVVRARHRYVQSRTRGSRLCPVRREHSGHSFSSFGGSPMDIPGTLREALGNDTLENTPIQMVLQAS